MTSPVSSLSEEKMDSPTSEGMFGETFTIGNGEEIAVEPLENGTDGKSEDCKICELVLIYAWAFRYGSFIIYRLLGIN